MKLAILIDADNIAPADADEIFATAAKLGEPITRRAFGSVAVFTGKEGWKAAVREHAIEARPQVNNIDRKNTADFALIIDAMDCLAKGRCDGFVIVSSDSDFTSLAQRLRDDGKEVYGIGDDRALQSFRKACTQFFELKKKAPAPPAPTQPASPAQPKQPAKPKQPAQPKKNAPNPKQPAQPKQAAPEPKQPASPAPQTEFQEIVAKLRERGCKTLVSLHNCLKDNLNKTDQEAGNIIASMINGNIISLSADEANKITWHKP